MYFSSRFTKFFSFSAFIVDYLKGFGVLFSVMFAERVLPKTFSF